MEEENDMEHLLFGIVQHSDPLTYRKIGCIIVSHILTLVLLVNALLFIPKACEVRPIIYVVCLFRAAICVFSTPKQVGKLFIMKRRFKASTLMSSRPIPTL